MRPDGLDNFYQKYTEAYGIPVLSRVAIMAASEVTLDIPEHSHLDEHMNQRARGLGATITEPVSTGAEENVLCEDHDRYHREDIFLHEFAHAIDGLGANIVIPNWHQKRQHVYNHAKSTGLWNNTYAMTNPAEYFAEGVQSFFNVNDHANPTNGIHNDIDTQAELKHYDPQLYNLILEVFPCNNHYLKRCGTTRHQEQTQHIKMDCNTVHYTFPENTDPNCQDERVECLSWSRTGECHSNPSYMEHHCKASCNVCTQAAAGQCTDSNTNCPDWARSGECENNPGYMLHSCKYSCENCDGSKLIGR
nr:hypothetical protein BaRGS_016531 [Batillaria attramentaria]